MSDLIAKPKICLTMIVKNEAHIVHEAIEAVAPYLDYWVIVDTGSEDGTQELIRSLMAEHGIPGELIERPWRNFGHNRTEAFQLAQGHGDYHWLMDADDTVEGTIDFSNLSADCYWMRVRRGTVFWRPHLFRDGVAWYWQGVVHEHAVCDDPHTSERLEGDYLVVSRSLGARGKDPMTQRKDCEVLLEAVQRQPDAQSVYHLAQTYADIGEYAEARRWWEYLIHERSKDEVIRDEVIYYSMYRLADVLEKLGEPWPDVLEAFLRAWEFRPVRAEALSVIAFHYLSRREYELGYLFASRAAEIALPVEDSFFVHADVYQWRALDEKAVCASWTGRQAEALSIWRELLARDIGELDCDRIRRNRDLMVSQLVESCAVFPERLVDRPGGRVDAEVTVSVVAGADVSVLEATLNSFLRCCSDVDRVGRFVVVDAGLSDEDRQLVASRYGFVEFVAGSGSDLDAVRAVVGGRYWLHLGQGWRFFAEEALIGRLVSVLEDAPQVSRVGINLGDAEVMSADSPVRGPAVCQAPGGSRYVLTDVVPVGPAMVDLTRPADGGSATLNETLCIRGTFDAGN